MSPQRVADAANISPYPFVVRQERQPPPPPASTSGGGAENSERARPAKGKKKPKPPRPVEEEPRFNVGPRTLRPPQASRTTRRGFRFPGRTYPEDQNSVPDYPPPSFQEAINTPPLSVSASTVSLVQPSAMVPLIFPLEIIQEPIAIVGGSSAETGEEQEAQEQEQAQEAPRAEGTAEADDNASISEESIFIIDPNSVPFSSTDLPSGAELRKRVHKDWRTRRGVEFPGHSPTAEVASAKVESVRSRLAVKPPALVLDVGSKIMLGEGAGNLSPTSSKRRFLSLSPLRTIFPPKSPVHQDRAMSAHPSPSASSYSISQSTFFRNISTSFLPMLPSGHHKSESLSRKIFAHKGKERLKPTPEQLEVWEVLEEETYHGVDQDGNEHPSLMSAMASIINVADPGTSPTRSQSFTFGTLVSHGVKRGHQPKVIPKEVNSVEATTESPSRDWKGPSTAFIDRPINRRTPVSPSLLSVVSGTTTIPSALMPTVDLALSNTAPSPVVLAPVRLRAISPSPSPSSTFKHTAQVVYSSPLRANSRPNILISNQEAGAAMYQRALETPLPVTPVHQTEVNVAPAAEADGGRGPDTDVMSSAMTDADATFLSRLSPQLTLAVQQHLNASSSVAMAKANSTDEPLTPTRHHYVGRPLPRPPPTNRVGAIDSTYAPAENTPILKDPRALNSVPEGLLIDLDDTTLDAPSVSGASTPRSLPPTMSQNVSSVDLVRDGQGIGTPRRSGSPSPSHHPTHPYSMPGGFSELTDLDLLLSSLADRAPDGTDYETLLLLSELIGPASPHRAPASAGTGTAAGTPSPNANISLIGRIEELRRRTTASGRVKVKLALLAVAVDRCGICLAQFRHGEAAALTSRCQHTFHEGCLGRWLARVRTCPMCRVPLDADMDTNMR